MFSRGLFTLSVVLIAVVTCAESKRLHAADVSVQVGLVGFTVDADGEVKCRLGVEFAIPFVGGITIGHEFQLTPECSYLVFRNRRLGRDDVFKIPSTSRVEVIAAKDIALKSGDRIVSISPDEKRKNCFVVEFGESIEGNIDLRLHFQSEAELLRLDLGLFRAYLIVDAAGRIRLSHRIGGETVWPVESLRSATFVRSKPGSSSLHLVLCPKRSVDLPVGHVANISEADGSADRIMSTLQRIAPLAGEPRIVFPSEVARVDGEYFPIAVLLDNHDLIIFGRQNKYVAMNAESTFEIAKGNSPTRKRMRITPSDSAGEVIEIDDIENSVDFEPIKESLQQRIPGIRVHDSSRSNFVGLLICWGLPVAAFLAAAILFVYGVFRVIGWLSSVDLADHSSSHGSDH